MTAYDSEDLLQGLLGGTFRGLAPRVLGQTEQGNRKKGAGPVVPERQWDEPSLLAELEHRCGAVGPRVARRLLERANKVGATLWWGKGSQSGSVFVSAVAPGRRVFPFAIWTYGKIEIQFQGLIRFPEFETEEGRRALQAQLNRIPGLTISDDALARRPSFPLALLDNDAAFSAFIEAMVWLSEILRSPG